MDNFASDFKHKSHMKTTLIRVFTIAFAMIFALDGCKKDVDYSYPMEIVYLNETGHSISLTISSDYTPMDIVLGKGGRYSRTWASGSGPNYPPQLTEAKVVFDDEYTVFHRITDQPGTYHNVCNSADYKCTTMKDVKTGRVYTFTFTEEDYNYAVNASKAD